MAPVTRGAASEVPVWREMLPLLSEIRISSPGATMNRLAREAVQAFAGPEVATRQAVPGVLEKFEIVPSTPTDPTISRVGLMLKFQGTFVVWLTPSLPAAVTRMVLCARPRASSRLLLNTPFQPGLKVQPGTPSEAFTTVAGRRKLPAILSCEATK